MNFLVLEGKIGHVLHFFLPGNKCPDRGKAKSAKKEQQGDYAKPLDTIDGLKQIFVHFSFLLKVVESELIGDG